jgi:hypothetical protein
MTATLLQEDFQADESCNRVNYIQAAERTKDSP